MDYIKKLTDLVTALPVLTRETALSVQQEIRIDKTFDETILGRLKQDNPVVGRFITDFAGSIEHSAAVIHVGTIVYRFLEKQGRLPQVFAETRMDVQQEILGKKSNGCVLNLIERVRIENPLVVNFVTNYSMAVSAPIEVAYTGMLTYRLLERQTELNKEMLLWLEES